MLFNSNAKLSAKKKNALNLQKYCLSMKNKIAVNLWQNFLAPLLSAYFSVKIRFFLQCRLFFKGDIFQYEN